MPKAAETTWEAVLALPGLIGSEIQARMLGVIRHGKIEKAEINGEKIHFKVAADDNDKLGKVFFINTIRYSPPYLLDGGKIIFALPFIGDVTIFIANGHTVAGTN